MSVVNRLNAVCMCVKPGGQSWKAANCGKFIHNGCQEKGANEIYMKILHENSTWKYSCRIFMYTSLNGSHRWWQLFLNSSPIHCAATDHTSLHLLPSLHIQLRPSHHKSPYHSIGQRSKHRKSEHISFLHSTVTYQTFRAYKTHSIQLRPSLHRQWQTTHPTLVTTVKATNSIPWSLCQTNKSWHANSHCARMERGKTD